MTRSAASPVTFEQIRDWLVSRPPWPREILKAIARAGLQVEGDETISSNHLHRDPEFQIADNSVNTIPAIFSTCCTHGWLEVKGREKTVTVRGHGRNILTYEVTPAGRKAFARFAEVGAGSQGKSIGEPDVSPPRASSDLGDDRPSGSRHPSGTTGDDPDGGQGKTAPSGLLPLPGFDSPDRPSYMDFDLEDTA